MKRIIMVVAALLFVFSSANAQNVLRNLGDRAKNNAQDRVENKVNNTVDNTVDKVFDTVEGLFKKKDKDAGEDSGKTAKGAKTEKGAKAADGWDCEECGKTGNTGKFCDDCGAAKPAERVPEQPKDGPGMQKDLNSWVCPECGKAGNTGKFCSDCGAKKPAEGGAAAPAEPQKPQAPKSATAAWNRYDFVAGDEVIFEDTFEGEQMGEVPSKWDVLEGDVEIAQLDGETVMCAFGGAVEPLMTNQKHYLTDQFTLEFDFYEPIRDESSTIHLNILRTDRLDHSYYWNQPFDFSFWVGVADWVFQYEVDVTNYTKDFSISYEKNTEGVYSSDSKAHANANAWNHISLSFNKRAVKVYLNENRVANGANMFSDPAWFCLDIGASRTAPVFIKNVKLCKGAVPLYDKLATEGKIVTYGITFDTGKATIKPESMGEINRIKGIMDKDASLKFEVQGHCDNTGSVAVNDKLSQQRAEAIVDKLVELGIAKDRLTAVGKGSHNPIADNSTDEGRAKNRRVEFIKK